MHGGQTPVWPLLVLLMIGATVLFILPLPDQAHTLSGTVVTLDGPLEGATVRLKGQGLHAVTDSEGRFSLDLFQPYSTRITAAAPGHIIAGQPVTTGPLAFKLKPLPSEDCERYEWVDPTPDSRRPMNCGNCHSQIYREWAGSGHARAATGIHFRSLFDGSDTKGRPNRGWSLLADHPDGAGVCTACHAPTVASNDPAYFDLRQARGVGALGVHCDYCHKIHGTAGEAGVTHGRFGLNLLRPADGQHFFGPLDDVDRGEDACSPLYRQSRYCAPCHEGTVFGVHVYSTYSEWFDSPARRQGQQCQSCHMKPTGQMANIAPGHGGLRRDPMTLGNHRFFAGSREAILRDSLRLRLESRRSGETVEIQAVVEAWNVGHAVPTGFIDRHLVLHLEAMAEDQSVVALVDGPRLPELAGAEVRGQPGKLYARVLKDFDGQSPAPFWRADPDTQDTRLRPGEPDLLRFTFPAQTRHVRARLLYRRFWPGVAQAKGFRDNETLVTQQALTLP